MALSRIAAVFAAGCLAAGLSGCAAKEPVTSASAPPPALTMVAKGIAMPAGYKVNADRKLIFGNDENWTGRLAYNTKTSADEVFDFLHREMPNFGWVELSAMRSDASLMTFVSDTTSRVATIHIGRGSILGSTEVDLVVAPKESAPVKAPAKASPR